MTRVCVWSGLAVILWLPSAAAAQQPTEVGWAMGYPSGVGVLIQVSEAVAVRPQGSVSHSSSDGSSSFGTNSSSTWKTEVGAAVLLTLRQIESTRVYVAPMASYGRGHSSSTSAAGSTSTGTSNTATAGVMFGIHYRASQHFGMFGETGLGYGRTSSTATGARTTTQNWSSQSGAGIVAFF